MAPIDAAVSRPSRAASPPPRKSVTGKACAEESKENADANKLRQQEEPSKKSVASSEVTAEKPSIKAKFSAAYVKEKFAAIPPLRATAAALAVLALALLAIFPLATTAPAPQRGSELFQEGLALAAQHPAASVAAVAAPLLLVGAGLAVRKVAALRGNGGMKVAGKAA
mmetsp:Transcript_97024/g.257798  ORF Transcript_97024/g.257798 Transcript_97024/m.257798 type:complete len:168 (-) Transcript_97024:287-790(-)